MNSQKSAKKMIKVGAKGGSRMDKSAFTLLIMWKTSSKTVIAANELM